jgi:hypothetical protein
MVCSVCLLCLFVRSSKYLICSAFRKEELLHLLVALVGLCVTRLCMAK